MTYRQLYSESTCLKEAFWMKEARRISWFNLPESILTPVDQYRNNWYEGGTLNTCYLAVDHHVENGRGDQMALIYDSPVTGRKEKYTYRQLQDEVSMLAGVLNERGVEKGDRVIIYMPMIPQVVFAMLACARIGAVHSVVFGGFAPHELAIRIDDASPKAILAASCGKEVSKIIPYKPILDAALVEANHKVDSVIIYQRELLKAELKEGRDYDWEELLKTSTPVSWVEVDATDPLYILYTSGTTGTPKGIIRDSGGHAVAMHMSMEYIYGVKPGDVFWAASDVGWVVGHSYIVYAPLIYGCTTIVFEGKPVRTPDPGTFWRVIDEYKVDVLFTAPTAIRAIKKEDPEGKFKERHDTSSLKKLFLAGERTDVATYEWATSLLEVPVIDHWWQTESGWPMLANPTGVGMKKIKPGSAGLPVFGYDIQIVDHDGNELPPNTEGIVVVRLPLPPGVLPDLWKDPQRFESAYMTQFPGYFSSGDGGFKDEDGYVYITGRIDDLINVAGHRLSTAEMEEVVASHPEIAECAVVGIENELKGQIPVGYVVLKAGSNIPFDLIEKDLIHMVRERIGPVASFKTVIRVERLPKTRSGKILRNIIRSIADGKPFTTPSTIEDISVLNELKQVMTMMEV
ncbi:MAG: acetate--CoA ligase [Saprospiraceae bacterium]|nr:acetate--CoA ligase [Saprospiraceae bacterium]